MCPLAHGLLSNDTFRSDGHPQPGHSSFDIEVEPSTAKSYPSDRHVRWLLHCQADISLDTTQEPRVFGSRNRRL